MSFNKIPLVIHFQTTYYSWLVKLFKISKQKTNYVNQNQGWEPIYQKYKANENKNRRNPKKKQKQTTNKNQAKNLCEEDSWLWNDNQQITKKT
jgi:hypothetical protein